MTAFTALYDACVLYPAPLRDLLMQVALTGLFRARWTDQIHEEWIRNLLKKRPDLSREKLERTRTLMNESVLDCLVTGYEDLILGLQLPDPDDQHVLAAAIQSGSTVIVTYNLSDFPSKCLEKYCIEAQHPDEFIAHLMDLSMAKVCEAAQRQRKSLRNPPMSVDKFLTILSRQDLPQTVSHLTEFKHLL